MILALIGVFFFSENQSVSLVLTFVCGALSMAVGTPVNIIMLRSAKNSEMMAAAFMQAAFNVGNSLGAFFGGLPLNSVCHIIILHWLELVCRNRVVALYRIYQKI
jgi:DHA1 family arabinose polymer transporter-like MFS transporter